MDKPEVGVAVIIRYNGKFLFAKRLTANEYGKYGVPGGKLDFGETLEEAVRREVLEETNMKLKFVKMLPVVANNVYSSENGEDLHFICFWFEAELDVSDDWDGKIDFIELNKEGKPKTEGWKWFSEEECKCIPVMRSTPAALAYYAQEFRYDVQLVETNDKKE